MINKSKEIIAAFKAENINVLNNYAKNSQTKFPCFTYNESNNSDSVVGDTSGYSNIQYTVEVWDNDYARFVENCKKADRIMKKIAFIRESSIEQSYDNLYRKIMIYNFFGKEIYD